MLAGNVPRDDDVRLKDQDPALSGAWKHKVSHLADFKGERFFAKIGSSDPDEFIGIRVEGRRVRGMWRGSLWVNPGARPMQINFTGTDDDNHKVYRKGIYQVEGDDLTICLADDGKDRPKDFEWPDKPGRSVFIFGRVIPAKLK
jgi:uncharacterized protein (TIGR03067 family)